MSNRQAPSQVSQPLGWCVPFQSYSGTSSKWSMISLHPRDTAIEQLEKLGVSTYAARTFLALVSLGTGTARDLSQVSDVPRTRVYDAIGELHGRGARRRALVDTERVLGHFRRNNEPIIRETTRTSRRYTANSAPETRPGRTSRRAPLSSRSSRNHQVETQLLSTRYMSQSIRTR